MQGYEHAYPEVYEHNQNPLKHRKENQLQGHMIRNRLDHPSNRKPEEGKEQNFH